MTFPRNFFRWLAILAMDIGAVVVLLALLGFVDASLTGPFAHVVLKLALPPAALIAGATAILAGAVASRRLAGQTTSSSARPHGELEPTAAGSSLVESFGDARGLNSGASAVRSKVADG